MKRIAYFLLLWLMAIPCFSQISVDDVNINRKVNYNSYEVGDIADDSTYWFKTKGSAPLSILVDFAYFDKDDATIDFFKGTIENDSIYYESINGLISGVSFPLTLVRATYITVSESDTMHTYVVIQKEWTEDLLGVKLNPGTVGSKPFNILITR